MMNGWRSSFKKCKAARGKEPAGEADDKKVVDKKADTTKADVKPGSGQTRALPEPGKDKVQKTSSPVPGSSETKGSGPTTTVPRAYFWSGVGLTAALAAASVVTGALAYQENQHYNDPDTPVSQQLEHRDRGQSLEVAMWTTLGAGIAAAAGTALLYYFSTPHNETEATAAAAQMPRLGIMLLGAGGSLSLEGRF